jgi:hypothetical protein
MASDRVEQMRRWARLGAIERLRHLREEEAAIRREFPELFGTRGTLDGAARARARKRPPMSAENRKAAAERMRKYWAKRRKAKAGN